MARSSGSGGLSRNGSDSGETLRDGLRPEGHSEDVGASIALGTALGVEGLGQRTNLVGADPDSNAPVDPAAIAAACIGTTIRDYGSPQDRLRESHPVLAAFFFKKTWDGIHPRETAVLTITATPVGVAFTFKCPSEARSYGWRVETFAEILDCLEYCVRYEKGDLKELKNGPGAQQLRENRKKEGDIRKTRK